VPLLQVSPAGQSDDKATFLTEFRALRDRAAMDYEELAARAHFPSDVLKDAENGPGLPGLPVLAAYVRACNGDVTEWEERWRRLASAPDHDAGLPTRPTGASPAAAAGARAGVTISPAEAPDTERIKAALRAHREREDAARRAGVAQPAVAETSQTDTSQTGSGQTGSGQADRGQTDSGQTDSGQTDSGQADRGQAAAPRLASRVSAAVGQATRVANGTHHAEGFSTPLAPAARKPAQTPAQTPAPARAASRTSQTAAPTRPGDRAAPRAKNLSSRPGLLALIVVLVLAACIALLALT
jgi:hypothetical protein